jgi:hypothetical protein
MELEAQDKALSERIEQLQLRDDELQKKKRMSRNLDLTIARVTLS